MNCQEFVDFLMDYLSGELPEPQRVEFERHLNDCPPCIVYLDTYKDTVKLGAQAYEKWSQDTPEELVQAILAARQKTP